jgi:Leucine-rich repeat (LRR) protein
MKIIFLILSSLLILNCSTTNAATLKCTFEYRSWGIVGEIYICTVEDNGIFDGSRVTIDRIEGEHIDGKTNADVQGFSIEEIPNVNYIPEGLEESFPNLISIDIMSAQLKEIKQTDVKKFPKLIRLDLSNNNIKIIEKDLFKYNPQLREIFFGYNEISHIDPEVFNHLNQLEYLWLQRNKCQNEFDYVITQEQEQKIQNGDCTDPNYVDDTTSEPIDLTTEKASPNNAKNIVSNFILCSITCLTILQL